MLLVEPLFPLDGLLVTEAIPVTSPDYPDYNLEVGDVVVEMDNAPGVYLTTRPGIPVAGLSLSPEQVATMTPVTRLLGEYQWVAVKEEEDDCAD